MNKIPSIWLIFMSLVWVLHSSLDGTAAKARGLSNAMQLEADLHLWATENAPEDAVSEIFDGDRRLLLGGEHPAWSFREMIENIATETVPPSWPGLVGLVLGVIGLISGRKPKERVLPNRVPGSR